MEGPNLWDSLVLLSITYTGYTVIWSPLFYKAFFFKDFQSDGVAGTSSCHPWRPNGDQKIPLRNPLRLLGGKQIVPFPSARRLLSNRFSYLDHFQLLFRTVDLVHPLG